jgi:dihydropteroate synthase
MLWRCRDRALDLRLPQVMGILNVTPDSFSDGGHHLNADAALVRAATLLAEGAAIIDVGGESTRPGASEVSSQQEMDRVVPVIERIAARMDVAVSVDTSKLAVMQAAVTAGACIVNDVRALRADGAKAWAARAGVGVCLMHMQGEPRSMQIRPQYRDVVDEVFEFLRTECDACLAAGIDAAGIVVDPGIGFGKTRAHNVALLQGLARFADLGCPRLIGVSRKGLIGDLLGGRPVGERLYGGLGLAAFAVGQGVSLVRTHDVGPTADVLRCFAAVMTHGSADKDRAPPRGASV